MLRTHRKRNEWQWYILCFTRPVLEPMIYRTRGNRAKSLQKLEVRGKQKWWLFWERDKYLQNKVPFTWNQHIRFFSLLAHSGVQSMLCCVFDLFVFVLCTKCCQFLWIVHCIFPLRVSLTFILNVLLYNVVDISNNLEATNISNSNSILNCIQFMLNILILLEYINIISMDIKNYIHYTQYN